MLAKLKLRNRIFIGYSFPLLLLMVLSGQAFFNAQVLDAALKKTEVTKTATQKTADAAIAISRSERAMRGLLLVGEEKSLRQSFELGINNFKESLNTAEQVVVDPNQKQRLKEMRELGTKIEEFDKELISLLQAGKKTEATASFATLTSKKLLDQFEDLQNEFDDAQNKILAAYLQDLKGATATLQLVAILGTILAITISISLGYVLASGIAKTIQTASQEVTTYASKIAHTIAEQERIILQQSASVNETTSIMEELGSVAIESASQAETSADGAQRSLNLAEEGTKTVGYTTEGISALKDQVTAIANQIIRLSEQTAQISTVSDIVADLANQTNMLALNAGVEAARAGEQGKGFAVVAGEIRKLADQSKKSAAQINSLVNEVQAAINSTVMVTDEGTKKASYGIKLVAETGDTFVGIADGLNNVFFNSQQILLNAKQQAVTVQQVVAAMNVINLGAKETASGIIQVKDVTDSLNKAAENLQAVI
jgi:methyl-accepting chemotaxis protein